MTIRKSSKRKLLAVAISSAPLVSNAAAYNAPSFNYDGTVLQSISWNGGLKISPISAIDLDYKLKTGTNSVPFSLANTKIEDRLLGFPMIESKSPSTGFISGDKYEVDFGQLPAVQNKLFGGPQYKIDIGSTFSFTEGSKTSNKLDNKVFVTDFNLYLDVYSKNKPEYKDFIGVQFDSFSGAASGGKFFVDTQGDLIFAASISSGKSADISLYSTPASPVPEPSDAALMGAGLAGIAALRRKRSS